MRWKSRKRQREVDCGMGMERNEFEQHNAETGEGRDTLFKL